MSIFKCKMCGGTIEFEQGATVGVCDSCGTKQTLPRLDDDKKAAVVSNLLVVLCSDDAAQPVVDTSASN